MTTSARPDLDAIKAHAQRNAGEAAPMMEMTTWEVLALVAWVEALELAMMRLLDRMDEVQAHPSYRAVWEIAQIHQGRYRGPQWEHALNEVRALLPPPAPR